MHTGSRDQRVSSRAPLIVAFVVGFATAGVVSWLTPDGNLVVTLVPAFLLGAITFAAASLWWRRAPGVRKH